MPGSLILKRAPIGQNMEAIFTQLSQECQVPVRRRGQLLRASVRA